MGSIHQPYGSEWPDESITHDNQGNAGSMINQGFRQQRAELKSPLEEDDTWVSDCRNARAKAVCHHQLAGPTPHQVLWEK